MTQRLAEIRRYPVKAMGGEALESAELDTRGLAGDRWYAVVDGDGRLASGKSTRRFRRRDAIFDFTARTLADGQVEIARDDQAWRVSTRALVSTLSEALGSSVRVRPERSVPHFDVAGLSLVGTATLDWFARERGIDADRRRLRPNLLVHTDEPFVEESWVGREVTLGTARLRLTSRVERCRTIDVAQDGVAPSSTWLSALSERDLCVAVYADVIETGHLSVGDRLDLAP